ncbi:hypothetical protein AB0I81_22795 [Nonomuraea sp. NPDC050404]|uniref:hypothetical protein n=1 Tax=Nonomuraea sp. NPDC050404 TaxID=3155783 RepID=UPI0033F19F36
MINTIITAVSVVVMVAALVASWITLRSVRITRLFEAVTHAHNQRAAANRALTAAYVARADPSPALASVAAAEGAVRVAEARLPRRHRLVRHYFASKEAS